MGGWNKKYHCKCFLSFQGTRLETSDEGKTAQLQLFGANRFFYNVHTCNMQLWYANMTNLLFGQKYHMVGEGGSGMRWVTN